MELNKFSVVSTNIEHDIVNNIILKKYKKNTSTDISIEELKELVDSYILTLKSSGIPIPDVIESYVEQDILVYKSKYCGKNIIELGFNISNFDVYTSQIKKMLNLVKIAIKDNLFFDPHPKNFVFKDTGIFYVDFFPPYGETLKEKRLSIAKPDEKKIINENFDFFTQSFLLEHFCGDFLNIDKNSEEIFKSIYNLCYDMKFSVTSYEDFIKKAKYIRSIEDERLNRGIFLL
jgi:hypothetical protein